MNQRFVFPHAASSLLALLLLLVGTVPARAQRPASPADMVPYVMDGPYIREPRDGPQVLVPKTIRVERKISLDFLLHHFTMTTAEKSDKFDKTGEGEQGKKNVAEATAGKQILFAYLGYSPSFPNEAPKNAKETRAKIGTRPARTIVWKDKDGKFCRETLVDTGRNLEPGTVTNKVHFIYAGLTQTEAKIADGIIATLKPFPVSADKPGKVK